MGFVIAVLGVLQIIGGVLVYLAARSAIHEILGAISFGMGVASFALGIAVTHLASIRDALEKRQS